ncbi:hypothetical protein EYC80_005010 [Monilinia laxa]|uniref:Cytochrome c oxidase copper chaperone n=1 Tax=Monilinia laxa TaxID=61186 RepID=A0A5N6KIM3_MONLA|nr:hypothetical protein EYC80_005010 [Monilinia laxa]
MDAATIFWWWGAAAALQGQEKLNLELMVNKSDKLFYGRRVPIRNYRQKYNQVYMYYLQSLVKDDIRHMNMSSSAINMPASVTSANMAADLKPAGDASSKPKPCCVCKEEKAARDECMLFSTAKDPQVACASMVDRYKSCMAGFGFNLP